MTQDRPRPDGAVQTCHFCGTVLDPRRAVVYDGPLRSCDMDTLYCNTECLLDAIDVVEGRKLKPRQPKRRGGF